MNSMLSFFVRLFLAVPVASLAWLISFFAFEQSFWNSTAISLGGGLAAYGLSAIYGKHRFLKKHRLSRKEYNYIAKNLQEAKRKIFRLNKALLSIRHIPSFTQRIQLIRVTRKIQSMIKKEPKRFYLAESFYFSHLDSALELSEKYVLLASQPRRNPEMEQALLETRRTLDELNQLIEKDLYQMLSKDMDHLQFELDVAKRIMDESGKVK
nr:5-bromo-4-chloroindolyl phosphate hydrolysis family protein [Ammoniphilus sp. YIM 78166]